MYIWEYLSKNPRLLTLWGTMTKIFPKIAFQMPSFQHEVIWAIIWQWVQKIFIKIRLTRHPVITMDCNQTLAENTCSCSNPLSPYSLFLWFVAWTHGYKANHVSSAQAYRKRSNNYILYCPDTNSADNHLVQMTWMYSTCWLILMLLLSWMTY